MRKWKNEKKLMKTNIMRKWVIQKTRNWEIEKLSKCVNELMSKKKFKKLVNEIILFRL